MSDYGMLLELVGIPTSASVLAKAGGPFEDEDEIARVNELAAENMKIREHDLEEYRKANPDAMDPRQRNGGEDRAGRDRREKEYQENYRRESEVTKAQARKEADEAQEQVEAHRSDTETRRKEEREQHQRASQPQPAHHDAQRQAHDKEKK